MIAIGKLLYAQLFHDIGTGCARRVQTEARPPAYLRADVDVIIDFDRGALRMYFVEGGKLKNGRFLERATAVSGRSQTLQWVC